MKRVSIFFLLIFLSLFLSACVFAKDFDPYLLISMNVSNTYTRPRNQFKSFEFKTDEFYINEINVDDGIIQLERDGKSSVYSFYISDYLFPFQKVKKINYITKLPSFANVVHKLVYIEVKDEKDKITVYDVMGNVILPNDNYLEYDIDFEYELEYNLKGKEVSYSIYEIIRYKTSLDIENKIIYKINYYTGERKEVTDQYQEYIGKIKKEELSIYGLDGYYGYQDRKYLYIYDKNEKFINKVKLEDNAFITNGKMIYQKKYEVDKDEINYDFVFDDTKYKLETIQVDLLTGKEKRLNVNYLIEKGESIKNENGKYLYAFCKITRILAGKDLESYSISVIVDKNGKILRALPFDNLNNIEHVNNFLVDYAQGKVYDTNLSLVLSSLKIEKVDASSGLIVCSTGNEGVINKNGEIIVPFKYDFVGKQFIDGMIYGTDLKSNHYLFASDGTSKQIFADSIEFVSDGYLLLKDKINKDLNNVKIINYLEKTLFECRATEIGNQVLIRNLYGSYVLYRFAYQNSYYYVLIDVTAREKYELDVTKLY